MKVIYQGIPADKHEGIIATQMRDIDPPEKTAQESYYHIASRDDAIMQQVKIKRTADWKAEREAEFRKTLAEHDACHEVLGMKFPKGETVEIPEKHALMIRIEDTRDGKKQVLGKIFDLIERGMFVEVKDEVANKPEPAQNDVLPQSQAIDAQEAPKRRGRPPKAA